ncbi:MULTISPECIES: LLM class flavin-dependent oxidoreductase [Protofrankia]|uniref:Luciferase family oxidoreductase, group 1 n=1 Tax=Candidatus Protofrankia datiscae TaxID=2716812 RepID=F8B181_9ACTN|nr:MULTISPECIES: LLM class flavin-dependent oxidoreductase [Protofrankia]AEH08819.1 luciferase family oxidoreductase, group 1 [Candidatus Protofrankia datiscae]
MALSRSLPLSVLDVVPVVSGSTPAQAVRNTLDLARRAEELNYHRYWLAEHHSMPGIASSATSILIGQVGAATTSIRVGSGGIMLPNHAPLIIAEQFGTLGALFPGRVDLGIGRAPGTDSATAQALRRSSGPVSADDFPAQLAELVAFLGNSFPASHPLRTVTAVPHGETPPVWLLGSSGYSAQLAGYLGLPFAFAHHFSAVNTLPALALYRSAFRPAPGREQPYAMVAAAVICADTDETAQWLAGPTQLTMLRLRQGRPDVFPTPEQAAAYPWTPAERAAADGAAASHIVGSPDTVRASLDALIDATEADEIMIVTNVHPHDARIRSYELIAEFAGLPGLPAPREPLSA